MRSTHLRLIAAAAALLHFTDSGVTAVSHHHGNSPCAHASADATHTHHGADCRHSHARPAAAASETAPAELPSPAAPHDHRDCAACRHLAQPLLPVLVMPEPVANGLVSTAALFSWPYFSAVRIWHYHSRAPPDAKA